MKSDISISLSIILAIVESPMSQNSIIFTNTYISSTFHEGDSADGKTQLMPLRVPISPLALCIQYVFSPFSDGLFVANSAEDTYDTLPGSSQLKHIFHLKPYRIAQKK